jgi:hypothetical protein
MSGYWQAVTTTDGDGKFEIPETPQFKWFLIPIGDPFYDVTIRAPGYQPDCYGALGGPRDQVIFLRPEIPGSKEDHHCRDSSEPVPGYVPAY